MCKLEHRFEFAIMIIQFEFRELCKKPKKKTELDESLSLSIQIVLHIIQNHLFYHDSTTINVIQTTQEKIHFSSFHA